MLPSWLQVPAIADTATFGAGRLARIGEAGVRYHWGTRNRR
jgi:hypothetical protein